MKSLGSVCACVQGATLTSRRRGLGVREQHYATLALLDELRERRLGALVCLDLTAEGCEVNRVADLGRRGCASGRNGGCLAVRLAFARDGLLDGLDLFDDGGFRLFRRRLGGGLLLSRAHWRRRRRLALSELNHV
jgi:hypothetical protein